MGFVEIIRGSGPEKFRGVSRSFKELRFVGFFLIVSSYRGLEGLGFRV